MRRRFELIIRLSNFLKSAEKKFIALLALVITVLALLNVVTRALNNALFWVDELLIYTMIWMVLIGSSVMVREKSGIATTFFLEFLSSRLQKLLTHLVDAVILAFSVVLAILCWNWYDLPTLIEVGFDTQMFASSTFNFIYQEPTNTLGFSKFWIWLVVPLISVTLSVHSVANILESLQRSTLETQQ